MSAEWAIKALAALSAVSCVISGVIHMYMVRKYTHDTGLTGLVGSKHTGAWLVCISLSSY